MDVGSLLTLTDRVCETGRGLSAGQALELAEVRDEDTSWLLAAANRVRSRFKGDAVRLCSIVNAKSGLCGEDCAFCAQSRGSQASVETYPLRETEWLIQQAEAAFRQGAGEFSIVTSGRKVSAADLEQIGRAIPRVRELGMEACASLGVLDRDELGRLKRSGLEVFHHNLETSRSFYPSIVSTRDFDDNVRCVEQAGAVGLKVCCGGIFGLGESRRQRIELLEELVSVNVDGVPFKFLIPI